MAPRVPELTQVVGALNYRLGSLTTDASASGAAAAQGDSQMAAVSVSERAARQIGQILTAEPPGTMLRVSVEGGGCSGFQYRFDMEQTPAPDDLVISRDGATVLIDPISLRYLEGAEIDFVEDLIGASFKIANPNATAACGCGTSFSV
jgi:iron-sulfur cluster assembly accessory protein